MTKVNGYRFTVEGIGPFPMDMARYDACFPDSTEDGTRIESSYERRHEPKLMRTVRMRSTVKPPTEGRWASFGWRVSEVKKY